MLDATPIEDLGRAAHIPKALGGGWLFLGERHAWFAPSYEATPRLIAEFSEGATVGVGHAQLFVKSGGAPAALYGLPGGEKLPLPVADVVQLFGAPGGVVAVRTDKGDLYASTAKGAPFQKVTSGVEYLAYDGKGIVVQGKNRTEILDVDGHLAPRPNAPGMTVSHNVDAFREPWPDFSRPPPEALARGALARAAHGGERRGGAVHGRPRPGGAERQDRRAGKDREGRLCRPLELLPDPRRRARLRRLQRWPGNEPVSPRRAGRKARARAQLQGHVHPGLRRAAAGCTAGSGPRLRRQEDAGGGVRAQGRRDLVGRAEGGGFRRSS